MKPSAWLLVGSLIANGVLVVALNFSSPSAPPSAGATGAGPLSAPAVATSATRAGLASSPPIVAAAELWSRLKTDDLDEFAHRLRAAGFPAKEVRALLKQAIESRRSARHEALLGKQADVPYWRSPNRAREDRALSAQLIEINREAEALGYKYVNGPDALADDEDLLESAKRRYGNLSLDKLQRLTAISHEFIDKEMLRMATTEPAKSGVEQAIAHEARQKATQAEIALLLTPAELEQYDLRQNAGGLRMMMENFRPSESEFKALFAIESKYRGSISDYADPSKGEALRAAQEKRLAEVQAVLGPERFADFQVATAGGNDKLGRLIARLDLPLSTITQINSVRDDLTQRATALRADPQLSPAVREAQLAALADEANTKLTAKLGARGYNAYRDMKGDWIRALGKK